MFRISEYHSTFISCMRSQKQNDFFMRIARKWCMPVESSQRFLPLAPLLIPFVSSAVCLFLSLSLHLSSRTYPFVRSFAHAQNISIFPLNAAAAAVAVRYRHSPNSVHTSLSSMYFKCIPFLLLASYMHKYNVHRTRRKTAPAIEYGRKNRE